MAQTFKEELLTCWRGLDISIRVIACFSKRMLFWLPWLLMSLSAHIGLTIGYGLSQRWGYTSLQMMAYVKELWINAGIESLPLWVWILPQNFFYMCVGFMILVYTGIGAALPWFNYRLTYYIPYILFVVAAINCIKHVRKVKPWNISHTNKK